jgi:hypothetical protein
MHAGHCLHYTGQIFSDEGGALCTQGVNVRATFKPPLFSGPCCNGNAGVDGEQCPKFLAPTPEQLAEHERESVAAIKRMLEANAAIREWEKVNGQAGRDISTIPCPTCGTTLRFCRTANHLYAECATPKCVKFRGNYGR